MQLNKKRKKRLSEFILSEGYRERFYWENGGRCFWCGIGTFPALGSFYEHDTFTIDHHVPLNLGGRQTHSNLVLACLQCNLARNEQYDLYRAHPEYLRFRRLT